MRIDVLHKPLKYQRPSQLKNFVEFYLYLCPISIFISSRGISDKKAIFRSTRFCSFSGYSKRGIDGENRNSYVCKFPSFYHRGGESQMMRKGVQIWGLFLVLVVVASVFSGVVSADGMSEDFTDNATEALLPTEVLETAVISDENISDLVKDVAITGSQGKDNIIPDEEYRDYQSMSLAQIQSFLENPRWGDSYYKDSHPGWKSYLATYTTTDWYGVKRSAAEIIYNAAQSYSINPELILTTLQKEQSLITNPSPSDYALNWAMGYAVGNDYYKGFGKQVEAATWQFDHYWTAYLDLGNPTSSGWGVGITKMTADGVSVTPQNIKLLLPFTLILPMQEVVGEEQVVGIICF